MKLINKISLVLMSIILVIVLFPSLKVAALDENKTLLTRTINTCYTDGSRQTLVYIDTNYTVATWTTYSGLLENALNIEDDEESTQLAIDNAKDALVNAKTALEFAGQVNLDNIIAIAESKEQLDYTAESWAILVAAKILPETTNDEVITKTTAINSAIEGLITVVVNNALIAAKALDDALIQADYTEASWVVLTNALALAETTNDEVIAKTTAINSAIEGLITIAANNNLINAKALDDALIQADYTVASWVVLTNALALDETTDAEVVAKTTSINNAISGLIFAGKANLDIAKASDDALVELDYTIASWVVLTNALALSETTNAEVVVKTTAINSAIEGLITTVANNDLIDAKALDDALTQTDYTEASWVALTNALALSETTNALVVTKTAAITNSINDLVFAGKENLDIAKTLDDMLVEIDYTVASWTTLTNALALAETTNAEVMAKTTSINNAIVNLITVISNSALDTSKGLAALLNEDDYTSESWTALTNALALAETTDALVVAKTTAINNAINELVFAGLANLNTAKGNANLKEQINYTVASWEALVDALALTETTNTEVVTKTTSINNAIADLEIYTNLTALTSKINAQYSDKSRRRNLKLTFVDYTSDSWANYILAIANGRIVEYNEQSLQQEVNNVTTSINNAINGLVFAGKANLDQVKALTDLLLELDYTVISWTSLTDALALVETTNAEIVTKTASINNAIDELVFAGLANLNQSKALVGALIQTDYTVTSWTTLTNALALAETTNVEVMAKTTAITTAINNLVFAGKANLDLAKASAGELLETDYTAASWTSLTGAMAIPETTNTLVVTKTTSINNAINGLVFTGKANLDQVKASTDLLLETDYTVTSWTTLTNALATSETTNVEVMAKTTAITTAINNLVFAGKANLDLTKATAGELLEADYTVESWTVLTNALALAETTNAEIVTKTTSINNAITGLVFAGKANLDLVKAAADELEEADYTIASWTTLTNALALAETTNTLVVTKTISINNAIAGLVFAGKANLDLAKTLVDELLEIDYTVASWATLTNALALVETTNSLVVIKTTSINNAISGLVFVGKANLDLAKALADELEEADYTIASWTTLTNALALEETTNALVITKTTAITTTINNLVFAGKTNLDLAKTSADELEEADYTVESWAMLTNAIALAETTNAEIVIKTDAINNAIVGLITIEAAENLINTKILADELLETDYTVTSWTMLTNALTLVETINAEIVNKAVSINNAISGLVFAGQVNLDLAKTLVDELLETDYIVASWATLTNALALVETTNSLVVIKTTSINNAITSLVFAGKANLDTAKAIAASKTQADHTSTSWTLLINALALPETTNAEMVIKTTSINNSINGLVYVGKANLDNAKAMAATKIQSHYTTASWTLLTTALAIPETTNALVVTKTASINNAINGLVFAGKASLDVAKTAAANKVKSNYTTASWTALTNALALPETTNALVVTKTTAINNAISGLKTSKPTIAIGQTIYLKAGTKYWANSSLAKAGVGGYTLKTGIWIKITRLASNGCFNVTGDLGWFNPSLL